MKIRDAAKKALEMLRAEPGLQSLWFSVEVTEGQYRQCAYAFNTDEWCGLSPGQAYLFATSKEDPFAHCHFCVRSEPVQPVDGVPFGPIFDGDPVDRLIDAARSVLGHGPNPRVMDGLKRAVFDVEAARRATPAAEPDEAPPEPYVEAYRASLIHERGVGEWVVYVPTRVYGDLGFNPYSRDSYDDAVSTLREKLFVSGPCGEDRAIESVLLSQKNDGRGEWEAAVPRVGPDGPLLRRLRRATFDEALAALRKGVSDVLPRL